MRKALIVGINDYPGSPLTGCLNDAIALAALLEVNGDGSPNFDVRVETAVKSKSKLKSLILELFSSDEPEICLLYFSGHGVVNEFGAYVATPDFTSNDAGVSMDEILHIANKSKSKNKVIILDCCHSGAMGTPSADENTARIASGISILTASKNDESSMEVNGHGVFTSLLLDALQGGAADLRGHITPGSVYAYIDQALNSWDQRPIFKTNITRFVSLRTIAPQVSLPDLRMLTKFFPTPSSEYRLDPSYEFTNEGIAVDEHVEAFKLLQKFAGVGLVVPVGEEHMYYAAQNSKACRLTNLGYHYWRLVDSRKL